jgi:glucokinase
VVTGGGLASAGPRLFDPLRECVRAATRFGDPDPVVRAALGEQAGRYGAAIAAWRAAGLDEKPLATWAAGE